MSKISVVMPTYNARKYVSEAIESVLSQSFADFEFIIVDDGSTDETTSVVRSYKDERIRLIQNSHDFIASLNTGLNAAKSKYIARMDADDKMHIDRLKIQYSLLEEFPQITVCSSWMISFGNDVPPGMIIRSTTSGLVKHPLLHLLQNNIVFHPTAMLRTDFLRLHKLQYEKEYIYAEDYKLWFEMARRSGKFYIETQPLLYYRVSESQVSQKKQKEQQETTVRIRKEILDYLLALNKESHPGLFAMKQSINIVKEEKLLNDEEMLRFFHALFVNNKNSLATGDK